MKNVNLNNRVFGSCLSLVLLIFPGQISTGQSKRSEDEVFRKVYKGVIADLDPDDWTKRDGVVSGLRIYYNLCGVDQMVTIFGEKQTGKELEIVYILEIVTANSPGSHNSGRVVNRRSLKQNEISCLLKYLESNEVFELPEMVSEKDVASSALIFAEKFDKVSGENKTVIRDFYESHVFDELMLMMYRLAWKPR